MATGQVGPSPKRAKHTPGHTVVDATPMPPEVREKLKRLGYLTVEQVFAAVARPETAQRMNKYLEVDVKAMIAPLAKSVISPKLSFKAQQATYRFGARLPAPVQAVMPAAATAFAAVGHVPAARMAPPAAPGAFGSVPDVNLIPEMPLVRDQAYRGTCVAHAAVATMEHLTGISGPQLDFSEQFLYWDCKSKDGNPTSEGTFLKVAMPLLVSDGCCLETTWPYSPAPMPGNEGQGPPPPTAAKEASTHTARKANALSPKSITQIKDELARRRCVAVSVVVYDYCWTTNDEVRSSGNVTMPFPGDVSNEGHAICLVGYEDLPGEPELGGGRFLLRNSWDSYWGVNCEFGSGYGTLPYTYLTTYGMEAFSID